MKNTKYINLFGGPGIGKSTVAAGLFHRLKVYGYDAELVPEFAKDLVWEERSKTLENQVYVSAKQYRNLARLKGKVDYVITDSPLLLGIVYATVYSNLPSSYQDLLNFLHYDLGNSTNILLKRQVSYVENGRNETLEQAEQLDKMFFSLLKGYEHVMLEPDVCKIYEAII